MYMYLRDKLSTFKRLPHVYEQVYDSDVEYGRVCGYAEQPFSFTSTSNVMIVYFHSDKVGGFTGFEAVAYHIYTGTFFLFQSNLKQSPGA